jgi:RNA-directed DNA polymerase
MDSRWGGWTLTIKGFFDNIDHALLMRALRQHVQCRHTLRYIERWLKAPVQLPDGTMQESNRGTPQGGVISPLLANLFLHYAFDKWVVRNARNIYFERYADDIVCHCESLAQAQAFKAALERRMTECKLQLHPDKTKVVYCRDSQRQESNACISFDFLGFQFKPRKVQRKTGEIKTGFVPAISNTAAQAIRRRIGDWGFVQRSQWTMKELSDYWNPILRGWMRYYGAHYRSQLHLVLQHFDLWLAKWIAAKHGRRRSGALKRGWARLNRLRKQCPQFFAHWQWQFA